MNNSSEASVPGAVCAVMPSISPEVRPRRFSAVLACGRSDCPKNGHATYARSEESCRYQLPAYLFVGHGCFFVDFRDTCADLMLDREGKRRLSSVTMG